MRMVLIVAGAAAPAAAQVAGEATWLWEVMTEDGDDVVGPGETATVTMSIDMEPDVNLPDGPVLGLSAAIFNTIGDQGALNGHIVDWEILSTLDDLTGGLTELHGVDLIGTAAAQSLNLDDPFSYDDPIDVFRFTWGTSSYSNYGVSYFTQTYFEDPDTEHVITVWEGTRDDFDTFVWPISEAAISFEVVPAPGVAAFVVGCGVARGSRRRARSS